mgnify:CR=1 FL=1
MFNDNIFDVRLLICCFEGEYFVENLYRAEKCYEKRDT